MSKVQQVLSRLAEDVISLYDDFDDNKITLREYQEELHNLITRYEERVRAGISQEDLGLYVKVRICDKNDNVEEKRKKEREKKECENMTILTVRDLIRELENLKVRVLSWR